MLDITDLTVTGPEIDAKASEALREAVSEQLLVQAEQAVLASPNVPEVFSALTAIVALRELPQKRRMRIVLHPSFRFWLQAMRYLSPGANPSQQVYFLQRLPDFVWPVQAVLRQLTRPWMVLADERGGLRCPSLGRFIELGPEYADQMIEITPTEDGVRGICRKDGLTIQIPCEDLVGSLTEPPATIEEHGYSVAISPVVADGRVEVSTRDPWLRVKLTGTNQRTDGIELFGVDDELYPDKVSIEILAESLSLLQRYWPEAYEDMTKFTHVIVPVDFGPDVYRAFTVSSRQGAIYVGSAPPDMTIEMLLHENAHVKLRQIQALDPLLSDPLDESTHIPVPWRPDPRPIPGVFEGLFVFSHVAEFEWRRLQVDDASVSIERLAKRIYELKYTINCLKQSAKFTKAGSAFFQAMERWVDDIADRAGSPQTS